MIRKRVLLCTLTAASLLAGCGDDDGTTSGTDAGVGVDAGPIATDAGPGSADAGPGRVDAGPGGADAGPSGSDAGPGDVDAGPPPVGCANDFAGCTTYMDLTAMPAVSIATGPGFAYTPKCVRVSAGTVVTIAGSTFHPLAKAPCAPSGTALDSLGATGSTTGAMVTFSDPGNYGIHCALHGSAAGTGMAANIQVVP